MHTARKTLNILNIQTRVIEELGGMKNVNGVGIGHTEEGQTCIRVNLLHEDRDVREKARQLSRTLSVPIQVRVVGFVRAF